MSELRGRLLVAACLLFAGCASAPYRPGTPLVDDALARRLHQTLDGLYPARFRAVHRVVLTVYGRQFTFTGYLLGRAPGDVRLVAAGDMGGTAFDVLQRATGDPRVLKAAPRMPRVVPESAARDAARIHFERPSASAALARFGANTVGLTDVLSDGSIQEFHFSESTGRLTHYLEARSGQRRYEIEFADYGPLPGLPAPVPRRITVIDRVRHYEASIRVVEMRPVAANPAAFAPEP